MKKALITATLLAALLLSGCADTTSSEVSLSDQSSESILQTTEQIQRRNGAPRKYGA